MCRPETNGQSSGIVTPIRRQHLRCVVNNEHWPRHPDWEVQGWINEVGDYLESLGGAAPALTTGAGHEEVKLWLNAALDMINELDAED